MAIEKLIYEADGNRLVQKFILFGLVLICVYPYLSCCAFFIFALFFGKKGRYDSARWVAYALAVSGIVTVCLVNVTKVPESDLLWYVKAFGYSKDYEFSDFILFGSTSTTVKSGKEPLYGAIVWVMNRLLMGRVDLFKFFMSMVEYLFLTVSVFYLGKKFKATLSTIVIGLMLFFFFPYIFTMSLHIVRQFLANSFVVLVLVLVCFSSIPKKYLIPLSVLPPLIHSTAFIFIPFFFIPALEYEFKEKKIWYIGVVLLMISIQKVSSITSMFVGESSSLGYALSRASRDTYYDLGTMSLSKIVLVAAIALLAMYIGQFSELKRNKGVVRFCNVIFFLGVFVLLSIKQSELSNRMYFYTLLFFPLLLMLASLVWTKLKYALILLSFFCLVYFPFFLQTGTWKYALPDSIWLISLLNLFN